MALDGKFAVESELSPAEALSHALGPTLPLQGPALSRSGQWCADLPHVFLSVSHLDPRSPLADDLSNGGTNLSLYFRLDKFELDDAKRELVECIGRLLRVSRGKAALVYCDELMLRKSGDTVTLQSSSRFWREELKAALNWNGPVVMAPPGRLK